jgi:DNA-binding XRE family transcriptional regulator
MIWASTIRDVPTAADLVKALRVRLGLTQDALAEKAEIRRTDVVRIEVGTNKVTSYALRQALAVGFGLSLDELVAYLSGKMTVEAAVEAIARHKGGAPAKPEADDPLPERASAVVFARAAGYPEDVIEKAYRARKGPRLSHDQWLDRLRGWRADFEAGIEERGAPATEEDFPKPRYRRDR